MQYVVVVYDENSGPYDVSLVEVIGSFETMREANAYADDYERRTGVNYVAMPMSMNVPVKL